VNDKGNTREVTPNIRARHAQMMSLSGGTGRPEDYLERLSFIIPFRAAEEGLLVFCGCCQGPLHVRPELGLWVSWQKHDVIAPLCAVCLDYLHQREVTGKGPATIYVLPEYDSIGQRYRGGPKSLSPVELAQLRMAEVESMLPRVEPAADAHGAAAIARQAFMETAGTLRGLGNLWKEQRPARLKLGQHMMGLKAKASAESLKEFDAILGDLPGAMQAYVEAKYGPGGGAK
jgi:hypothetical protein